MDTKVEDALEYIDPNIPRDDWVRVGMALKSEYGDSGFAVFDEWSQRGESYDKTNIRSTWRSITPNGNTRIGTLYHMAKEHGYKPFRVMSEDEKTRIAEERKRNAERIQQEYLKAEAEKRETQERVACHADDKWRAANPGDAGHAYLVAKGVQPHGLRQKDGSLLLPLFDEHNRIWNIQTITPPGEKRFLAGSRKKGLYFPILGECPGIVVCEGFATGATLAEATGYMVACAMDCGNLWPVAEILRKKHADAEIIIAADNDRHRKCNPGLTKALKAADAIGARVVVPEFPEGTSGTDFNDLHQYQTLEAIKAIVEHQDYARENTPEKPSEDHQGKAREIPAFIPVMQCLADVQPEPISWLWPGKIALGKVSLIAGDPGLGKSIITVALAAIVTRGGRWPVDQTPCPQGDVIMLSAEDDPGDTIRPRLDAAGADVRRVFSLSAIHGMNREGERVERGFCLDRDIDPLDRLLADKSDTKLVSVDPVSAYMGSTDTHNNSEVRAVLARLAVVAARHKVAVVVVTHLNKSAQLNAMYRATGSLAFVAAARAVFAVTKDPEEPDRRLLLPIKNNLGDDRTGYAYQITAAENGAPVLAWEPDPVETTLEELSQIVDQHKPRPVEQAAVWLKELLADGPVLQIEIESAAEAADHSWSTVKRAKQRVGIVSRKRFDRKWEWSLPEIDPTVVALRQATTQSEIQEGHQEDQKTPVPKVGPFTESGRLKVKRTTSGKEDHNLNRGKVDPLVAPLNPALLEAAQRACSGLAISPAAFIASLGPEDYPDIIAKPKLARYMAETLEARK